jgi:hypothetical protein
VARAARFPNGLDRVESYERKIFAPLNDQLRRHPNLNNQLLQVIAIVRGGRRSRPATAAGV